MHRQHRTALLLVLALVFGALFQPVAALAGTFTACSQHHAGEPAMPCADDGGECLVSAGCGLRCGVTVLPLLRPASSPVIARTAAMALDAAVNPPAGDVTPPYRPPRPIPHA